MHDSLLVRYADKYLGALICFFFSILHFFRPRRKLGTPRKVLMIELWELGAAVMLNPSIEYMKKQGVKEVCVLTGHHGRKMWELFLPKKNVFSIRADNIFVFAFSALATVLKLRRQGFDLVIDYELFLRVPQILSFILKTKKRAAYHSYRMEGLFRGTFSDYRCFYNQNLHISKNFLALTKTAIEKRTGGIQYDGPISSREIVPFSYKSRPGEKKKLFSKLKGFKFGSPLILVNTEVGHDLRERNWPREYYVSLIRRLLLEYPKASIVLTGTPEQAHTPVLIAKKVGSPRVLQFAGKTSFYEFMELLKISDLLITNDQGPAHLAALTKLKTVVIMGPESPLIYGPIGNAVALYSFYHNTPFINAFNHKDTKHGSNSSVRAISPATVFSFSKKMLENKVRLRTINGEFDYLL